MNANNLSYLTYCRCSFLLFAALGLTVTNHSFVAEEAELDSGFLHLDKGINVIDIRRPGHGNPVLEGRYYSDIYVNNVWKRKTDLQYLRTVNTGAPTLCLTSELLSLTDLVEDTTSGNASCSPTSTGSFSVSINFDLSALRSNIEIPQALLNTRPRGYIPPTQWQNGVPAASINYDANYYQYNFSGTSNKQTYLGLKAGLNLWGWALRHRGNESWNNSYPAGYQNIEASIMHDLAPLRAQFTLGDLYTSGELVDSLSLWGTRLASDE